MRISEIACNVIVKDGVYFVTLPDGTPIPAITSVTVISKAGEMPIAEVKIVVNLIETVDANPKQTP